MNKVDKKRRQKTQREKEILLHRRREERRLKKFPQKTRAYFSRRKSGIKSPQPDVNPLPPLEVTFDYDIGIRAHKTSGITERNCIKIRKSKNKHINLTFNMDKIYPSGMLWLYAEIYKKIMLGVKVTCNYPSNKKMEKLLQHINFFKLIKKDDRIDKEEIEEPDIHPWHVLKGEKFDGKKVSKFINNVTPLSVEKEKNIYPSILESIANVAEHAYKDDAQYKYWVMFGRITDDKRLLIVIGDIGKTIPKTMKDFIDTKSWLKTRSRHIEKDSDLIKLAAESPESRKWERHRGKGLSQAVKKIMSLNGEMLIYSRKGIARFPKESRQKERQASDLKHPVLGTIIEIEIPIQSDSDV